MSRDIDFVLNRVADLHKENRANMIDRWRIRSIMNGGADGMYAVMAWDQGQGVSRGAGRSIAGKMGIDLPTVNLVASGSERLAQNLGRPPTLKPPRADDEKVREQQGKKVNILQGWDTEQRLELHYPQIGRWLPGYSFFVWVINQRRDRNGDLYPVAELRDPFDVYPGHFGAEQQPSDMMVTRRVPLYALRQAYPERPWALIMSAVKEKRTKGGLIADPRGVPDATRMAGWEGERTGVEVVEYFCEDGTHIMIPEIGYRLDWQESLIGESTFSMGKRFAFDRLISQYHHSIGLMAMMGKMNALGLIAAEDATFRETNVFGDMIGKTYKRGRFSTNLLESNARVERPITDQQSQIWSQIDRLERQLRIGANYDVQQDGTSPNSFATGKGMRELQGSLQANVREYQLAIKHANEMIDSKRLKFAQEVYGSQRRKYYDMYGKEKWYNPKKDIIDARTRRIYGAMATFDDSETIVAGLQLLQGGVIDIETFRENIDNLEDLDLIEERVTEATFQEALIGMLQQESQMNPAAKAAIVEIMANPKDKAKILLKYFTPQEPEMSEEEEAFAGQPAGPAGPPPDVTTVLSQLEAGGAQGGVQTVGRL